MKFRILHENEWDEILLTTSYPSVYSCSEWFKAVKQSFGGEYHLVLWQLNREASYLIPFFSGKPWSSSTRIGSIGYGGPLPIENFIPVRLEDIQILAQKIFGDPCTAITTFPSHRESILLSEKNTTISHTNILKLFNYNDMYTSAFSGNVRNSIRKAQKHGVEVRKLSQNYFDGALHLIHKTQESVDASYKTPENFFTALITSEIGGALGAFYQNKLISVTVFVKNDFEIAYYLNGWDREYSSLNANPLLINEMILIGLDSNCKVFNFGESAYDSLRIAKNRWGGQEYSIYRWQAERAKGK